MSGSLKHSRDNRPSKEKSLEWWRTMTVKSCWQKVIQYQCTFSQMINIWFIIFVSTNDIDSKWWLTTCIFQQRPTSRGSNYCYLAFTSGEFMWIQIKWGSVNLLCVNLVLHDLIKYRRGKSHCDYWPLSPDIRSN